MLRRSRSAEEESSGESPVQALVSRMGDNALLYVLGAALAVMLIVYFSLFIGTPKPNDENTANFDGSRAVGTGTVGSAATVPGTSISVPGTPARTASSTKPRNGNSATEPASAQKLDLAWLPPGAELIASLRPSELWATPLLAGAFGDESWQSFAQFLAESSRLAITDFERVTIGLSGLPIGGAQGNLGPGTFGKLLRQADMIVCVQAVKPVDAGSFALEQAGYSPVIHGGRTYYRGPAAHGGEGLCVLFAEKTRIVLGRESSLVAAIDRNGAAARRPELEFADASGALVIVGVPRLMAGWFPAAGGTDSAWARFQPTLAGQARGVSLSLNLKGAGSVDLGIDARDTTALSSLQKALEQMVAERRQRTGAWPTSINPLLGELLDRLSGNLKVDAKGAVVHARGVLPKLPEAILSEVASWGSPLAEDNSGKAGEVVYEDLPSGPPRTPVTMLGVPGGLQMQAFVRWGLAATESPSGIAPSGPARQHAAKSPLRLELVLDLKGGPAAGGMARSICPTNAVTTDRGDKILWRDEAFDGATGREMVRLVHGTDERTADGVRVVLSSDRPALLPETITGFGGTLTLRSARETKLVSIPNLRNYVGKSLPQPELKGSGLTFKVERAGNSLIVRAKGRDLRTAGPGVAIDGKGAVLPNVKVEFVDSDSELQFILPTGESTPRDAGLQIAVCTSVKDHVIPFRFERLEVPPAPKKRSSSTPPRGADTARHPGPTQRAPGSATPIEPADLMQAFIDDPSGAKKRFQLQRLELTGTVVEVKSKGNIREIFLQVPQEGKSVSCDGFRDPALIDGKIATGDTVTIRGSFLGVGNSDFVSLTQCELVKP